MEKKKNKHDKHHDKHHDVASGTSSEQVSDSHGAQQLYNKPVDKRSTKEKVGDKISNVMGKNKHKHHDVVSGTSSEPVSYSHGAQNGGVLPSDQGSYSHGSQHSGVLSSDKDSYSHGDQRSTTEKIGDKISNVVGKNKHKKHHDVVLGGTASEPVSYSHGAQSGGVPDQGSCGVLPSDQVSYSHGAQHGGVLSSDKGPYSQGAQHSGVLSSDKGSYGTQQVDEPVNKRSTMEKVGDELQNAGISVKNKGEQERHQKEGRLTGERAGENLTGTSR